MIKVNIRKIGNSLGIILPAEATGHMHVKEGDSVFLTEVRCGYQLTAYSPEFERQMKHAVECMNKYRNAIRELSKR
ncbi:MAG: AbrB/MazE/SpoVT family DNA-binding domain-containing protein [Planctomycetota bacterium]